MSEQEKTDSCAQQKLYLDEWIRADIISHASSKSNAEKMKKLPLRQLIYYCIARRLAGSLEHAMKNSLFYQRKLAESPGRTAIGNIVSELKKTARLCLEQDKGASHGLIEVNLENALSRLPFTWPEELLEEPESLLAVSHSEVEGLISQSSSGTLGGGAVRKRIFCTKNDQERTIGFFMQGMRYLVKNSDDRVALLLSAGGRSGGNLADLFSEAMRREGVLCFTPSDPADECRNLAELAAFGPTVLVSSPRQTLSLFRSRSRPECPQAEEHIAAIKAGLKSILLSGDRISSAVSQILSRDLEAEVFMHYGMVESGLGTAVECGCKNGCHYRESDFFIEIISDDGVSHPAPLPTRETVYIDPDNCTGGSIYGPTPWGEITLTSLSREGTPLIRYRTGDSGRIIVDRCACGSALWRIEARGRIGDYIELPALAGKDAVRSSHIIHSSFDRALYALPWVKDHQVSIYSGPDDKALEIGVNVLVNRQAPKDEAAMRDIRKALAVIETRAHTHGVKLFTRLTKESGDFRRHFAFNTKRAFLRSEKAHDPALYTS